MRRPKSSAGTTRSTTSRERFARCIAEHGPDSVAFYVSGQLLTEDYYVFNKLAKGLVGTNNIDTNSRLCMSSAVSGYKQTLGADAPPCSYEDIDHARCLFIAGSNTAWAHPILYRRIEAAKARDPGVKIVVVDPRRTDTAAMADLHLAIEPGTDVVLFHGLLHLLAWDERLDRDFIEAHTAGFAALKDLVREYTPKLVAQTCGIAEADLVKAAQWFADGPDALAVLPGPQPVERRDRQERGPHQPASRDRPDRQAGSRPLFAHGPAECDGRSRGRRPRQSSLRASRPGRSRASR